MVDVLTAEARSLRHRVRQLEDRLAELQAERRRVETLLAEAEDGRYANNSRDYGRGVAFLARQLREVLSVNPNTGRTAVPFTLDPLVKTNYPSDKELPYFVQAHEHQLPQRLIELDDDWIRSTLDELVILDEDPLYWTARRGRYFEADPIRAYFLPSYDPNSRSNGELRMSRLLPEGDMWSLVLWTEFTDPRFERGQCATSVLVPWTSDRDLRVDVVRSAVLAISTQLDLLACAVEIPLIQGRIRLRTAQS